MYLQQIRVCFILVFAGFGAKSAVLPPPGFITDLAMLHDVSSLQVFICGGEKLLSDHRKRISRGGMSAAYVLQSKNISNNVMTKRTTLHIVMSDPEYPLKSIDFFNDFFNYSMTVSSESGKIITLLDVSPSPNIQDAISRIDKSALRLDSDVYLFTQRIGQVDLWEAYHIDYQSPVKILKYGTWQDGLGFMKPHRGKWVRRRDLEGHKLRVQTLVSRPFIKSMTPIGDGFYEADGLFFEIFNNLRDLMNFTYTIEKPPDNSWGSRDGEGNWNGMIRQLMEDKTDISVSDLAATHGRSQVTTFSPGIMMSYNSLVIKSVAGNYNLKVYLEPLAMMSWVGIILYLLIVPPILWFTAYKPDKDKNYKEFTFFKSYTFVASFITQRGWSHEPVRISPRISFLCLALGGMLLYLHWEAMLISFLSARKLTLPFNSFEGVLSTDYTVLAYPGTASEDALSRSGKDTTLGKLWEQKVKPYFESYRSYEYNTPKHLMANPKLAAMEYFPGVSMTKEFMNCQIVTIKENVLRTVVAFAFQKNSPYVGVFGHFIKEMREKGTLSRILDGVNYHHQKCPDYSGKPMGFDSCLSPFFVLAFGLIACIVAFILECLNIAGLKEISGSGKRMNDEESSMTKEQPKSLEDQVKELTYENKELNYLLKIARSEDGSEESGVIEVEDLRLQIKSLNEQLRQCRQNHKQE